MRADAAFLHTVHYVLFINIGKSFHQEGCGIGSGVRRYVGRGLHFVIAKVCYSEGSFVRRLIRPVTDF